MALAPERQKDILAALGFSVIEQGGRWQVSVPSWRRDMDGAPDVVEEVTRITGFDAIASVPLPRADGVAKPTATPEQLIERRLRRAAAAAGFDEAVTRSEEHTSELQSLMRISYAVFCLTKKKLTSQQ